MRGRRTAAMLCVVLAHALFFYAWHLEGRMDARVDRREFNAPAMELFFVTLAERETLEEELPEPATPPPRIAAPRLADIAPPESSAITAPPADAPAVASRGFIDWPRETQESAARVLEQEREAERIAKMFAGPDGTWASLTQRQRSKVSKFKWKPGVDGLERDENGNTIYKLPNGCALVNFVFFGCPIGKEKINDDMFENMRLYFDEQRLPQTNEGNGTEPESRRPPKWSKPLPER